MKKLVFLLTAVLFTAISANVYAQGTGVVPGVGSTHNYSVAPATPNGNNYAWSVTEDIEGNTLVASTVATLSSSGGTDVSAITITWLNPTIGDTYYVHVTETATAANGGCTNRKVLAIKPANLFELEIENFAYVDDKDTGAIYEICPADVLISSYDGTNDGTLADAQDFTYNYQKDSLFYRIYPIGINTSNTSWNAEISVTNDAGTQSLFYSTDNSNYTAVPVSGVIPVGEGNSEVFVKVVIDNSTSNDGTTKNDVTTELVSGTDENNNSATDLGNTTRLQTVKARPNTSNIITTE